MKRFIFLVAFLLSSIYGWSQSPWNVDFRPTLSFSTSNFDGRELRPGFGADLKLMYRIMPHLKAVGGWGFQSFDSKMEEDTGQIELRENSFFFGFELRLPINTESLSYLLYAGGVAGQINFEDRISGLDTRSDYQLGWELGGGVEYHLDERWSFKPQLRYRLLPGTFESGNVAFEESLRYLAFSVSISYQL